MGQDLPGTALRRRPDAPEVRPYHDNMKLLLKFAAPYIAVAVFWCIFRNAWVTILAYHLQVLFWSRKELPKVLQGWNACNFLLFSLPCVLGGPLIYFLMPHIAATPLAEWLAEFKLTGISLLVMIPYFGLVHPILEQAHWGAMRRRGWYAHPAFAGYHALVLYQLLNPAWLAACLLILCGASFVWDRQTKACKGLLVPSLGHIIADFGIVVAAWLLTT